MNVSRLLSVAVVAALGVGLAPGVATARSTPHGRFLPEPLHGAAAVRALGDNLGAAAARSNISAARLKHVLLTDKTAWVGPSGNAFYVDPAIGGDATTATGSAGTVAAPTHPLADSLTLHSKPGSSRTIYLDFDGATISNTWWNDSTYGRGIPNGTHVGFSLDGDYTTFSDAERAYIQDVWRQVADAYSPFDVDVTTQDPGTDALTRTSSTDQTYGERVLITDDTTLQSQACGGCAGMAVVGQFDDYSAPAGYFEPALVFTYNHSFAPWITAQSATHEVGHTLGLSHDGKGSDEYYQSFTAWAPIMGAAFDRSISQWSKGEYTGATNTEDDLAVMQDHGAPLRADDHGDTTDTAEQLGDHPTYDASGVITTRTDKDVFALDVSCTGNLAVEADGIGSQSTLDIKLTVTPPDGAPTVVDPAFGAGTGHVATGTDAGATIPAVPGRYYVTVDGVGSGNAADGTGYTDYASLGQYHLTATACDAPGTPPPPAATAPGAPTIRAATSGARRKPITAGLSWDAPASDGGSAITGYQIRAEKLGRRNRVSATYLSGVIPAGTTSVNLGLRSGKYRFAVLAINAIGSSAWSATSRTVTAR